MPLSHAAVEVSELNPMGGRTPQDPPGAGSLPRLLPLGPCPDKSVQMVVESEIVKYLVNRITIRERHSWIIAVCDASFCKHDFISETVDISASGCLYIFLCLIVRPTCDLSLKWSNVCSV